VARRKRKYYESYEAVKSEQRVVNNNPEPVIDWEVQDMFLNIRSVVVNKRRRGRVGHVEKRAKG